MLSKTVDLSFYIKRMKEIFFAAVLVSLLFSCSGNTGGLHKKNYAETGSSKDTVDFSWPQKQFEERFTEMINTFGSQDVNELNKFISPEFGLLIIESNNGAMPHFHIQKQDDDEYRQHIEHICNSISFDGKLLDERLPRIDCDSKNFYTKPGSFVQDTNLLGGSDIWKYGNLQPDDEKFAEHVISNVSRTVILTYSYTFYFSYYQDNWYLSIIDMRKPCGA